MEEYRAREDASSWADEALLFRGHGEKPSPPLLPSSTPKSRSLPFGWKVERISRVARTFSISPCMRSTGARISGDGFHQRRVELAKKYDTRRAAAFHQRDSRHIYTKGRVKSHASLFRDRHKQLHNLRPPFTIPTQRGPFPAPYSAGCQGGEGASPKHAVFLHTKRLPLLIRETDRRKKTCPFGRRRKRRAREKGGLLHALLSRRGGGSLLHCRRSAGFPSAASPNQEGHIMAALYSAGRMDLWEKPFWAFHVSGGTTELLQVEPDGQKGRKITVLGGKRDICAGQLIDRTGVMLGLNFPCGKELDALSLKGKSLPPMVSVKDGWCDFSGLENKLRELFKRGESSGRLRPVLHRRRDGRLDQIISGRYRGRGQNPPCFYRRGDGKHPASEFSKNGQHLFRHGRACGGQRRGRGGAAASLMEADA